MCTIVRCIFLQWTIILCARSIYMKISMDLLKNIGIELVNLRKVKGISQEKLALNANIDRRYMSDIENGRRNISVEMLSKIARALGAKASEILKVAEGE